MYSKDIERLARSLHAQRLERDYIVHYLMENYQLEPKTIDEILERVGVPKKPTPGKGGSPKGGEKPDSGPKRQSFY